MRDNWCAFSWSLQNNKAINKALQEEKKLIEKLKNQLKVNNMKDLKIEVPEGYEIDKEKSTFERIVFKKKDGRVRSWEDLREISGFFISTYSESVEFKSAEAKGYNKNIFPTKQDSDSALALAQLLQLRQQWINDYDPNWKPVWADYTENHCIIRIESQIEVSGFYSQFYELSFPTQEMAEDFRNTFEELLKIYFKITN